MAHSQHINVQKTFSSGKWFKFAAKEWRNETKKSCRNPLRMRLWRFGCNLWNWAKRLCCLKQEKLLPIPLDEFNKRKLLPGESPSLFAYELKDCCFKQCLTLTLISSYFNSFFTGLPLAVAKKFRASKDAMSPDKAVECAQLLMVIETSKLRQLQW